MAGTGTGLSIRDKRILDLAFKGLTIAEIADEVHTTEASVALEIDRLTGSLDWLSELQVYRLSFHALQGLLGKLKDRAESGQDAHQTKNYLDAIRLVFEQLEKQRAQVDADIDRVQAAQAKVLMDIVDRAFYYTLGKLEKRLEESGVPRAEVEDTFRGALVAIAAELDAEDG